MFDFLLNPIILAPACLLIGGFAGVGLGRRSKTANAVYDRGREEYQELLDRAERAEAKLRDKGKL